MSLGRAHIHIVRKEWEEKIKATKQKQQHISKMNFFFFVRYSLFYSKEGNKNKKPVYTQVSSHRIHSSVFIFVLVAVQVKYSSCELWPYFVIFCCCCCCWLLLLSLFIPRIFVCSSPKNEMDNGVVSLMRVQLICNSENGKHE